MGKEVIVKALEFVSIFAGIAGGFWILTGYMDYFQGRKNKDNNKQDAGIDAMTNGLAVTVGVPAIIAIIIAAINAMPV